MEDIGWLFIDESRQATPQSDIVGVPLQIPRVVTLNDDQPKLITNESSYFYYLIRSEVSVQEIADLNNKFSGTKCDSKNNTK